MNPDIVKNAMVIAYAAYHSSTLKITAAEDKVTDEMFEEVNAISVEEDPSKLGTAPSSTDPVEWLGYVRSHGDIPGVIIKWCQTSAAKIKDPRKGTMGDLWL